MTVGVPQPVEVHDMELGYRTVAWVLSAIGGVVALIGGWLIVAPDDGTISILGRSWAANDVPATWGPWLLILGGAVATSAMAACAIRDWNTDASRWTITAEVFVAAGAFAALFVGLLALL